MSSVTRIWIGFVALGAGLIHLAMISGSSPALIAPLALIGAAEFAWGTFAFARTELPVPRVALAVALVPLVGWALLFLASASPSLAPIVDSVRPLPLAIATLFDLVIAVVIAVRMRRARDGHTPRSTNVEARPGRFLVAVFAGALVVAALTTPALAATEAGRSGQEHGHDFEFDFGDLVHGH